jgi:hypothetical protein
MEGQKMTARVPPGVCSATEWKRLQALAIAPKWTPYIVHAVGFYYARRSELASSGYRNRSTHIRLPTIAVERGDDIQWFRLPRGLARWASMAHLLDFPASIRFREAAKRHELRVQGSQGERLATKLDRARERH